MTYHDIGQTVLFGFQFVPKGCRGCDGSLMSVAQNQALFSLLGTTWGGDGITSFALPDLRGRTPLNQGQGPGLSRYTIGEAAGAEAVTLTSTQLPAHTHLVLAWQHQQPGGRAPGRPWFEPAPRRALHQRSGHGLHVLRRRGQRWRQPAPGGALAWLVMCWRFAVEGYSPDPT